MLAFKNTDVDIEKKLNLIQEAIVDWKRGELSLRSVWMVMGMIVIPQPEPSPRIIAYAKKLANDLKIKHD